MPSRRFAITLTISGLTLAVGGCSYGSEDKAGDAVRTGPVVLRLADGIGEETISKQYADEVARRSRGSLRIEIKTSWRYRQPQREARTLADVRAGKAEIGFDATRGFADAGVTSFDALHAPLLIDSLALEDKVLRGPLPAQMLKGLEPAGVVGIGILPGPLRRPLGLTRPLLSPSDYRGQTFGIVRSPVAAATLDALGATARDVPAGSSIANYKLDGLESNLWTILANGFDNRASAVTANVVLWPRPEVLYANRAALAKLTPQQRRVLTDAATATMTPALASLRSQEAQATRDLCGRGLRFATGDVAALQQAVAGVYTSLDARTRGYVKTIRALGTDVADNVSDCGAQRAKPKVGVKTPLDGTYRMHVSHAQAVRGAHEEEPVEENYGDFRYVLDRGTFSMTQKQGRSDRYTRGVYVVDGDRFTITIKESGGVIPNGADEKPGEVFDFKWSLYRHRLSLQPWHPEPDGYPGAVWTPEP